jgi:ubiquinone/menaquinone biosynthesis C-methylase UbiE
LLADRIASSGVLVATDDYAGLKGRFYRAYIRRPRAAHLVGGVLWGSDFRPFHEHLGRLASLAAGSTVLDAACGAGLALEHLDPRAGHRYVGIDRSPAMLDAAQRVADRRGFDHVELRLGDIASIPLPDGAADVGLLYNALHCVPDPMAVVSEVVRCLAPGATLLGSSLVLGGTARADRILWLDPTMGPGGTVADLRRWLAAAGLTGVDVASSGALAVFDAHR